MKTTVKNLNSRKYLLALLLITMSCNIFAQGLSGIGGHNTGCVLRDSINTTKRDSTNIHRDADWYKKQLLEKARQREKAEKEFKEFKKFIEFHRRIEYESLIKEYEKLIEEYEELIKKEKNTTIIRFPINMYDEGAGKGRANGEEESRRTFKITQQKAYELIRSYERLIKERLIKEYERLIKEYERLIKEYERLIKETKEQSYRNVNDSTSIGNSNIPKQSETTKSEKENRTIYKTDGSMEYNREQEK